MSPAMLTLVAAVLVYDLASERWEARSSMVETEASPRLLGALGSRRDRSWTRLENDILSVWGARNGRDVRWWMPRASVESKSRSSRRQIWVGGMPRKCGDNDSDVVMMRRTRRWGFNGVSLGVGMVDQRSIQGGQGWL